jgi:hypothetical protein
MLWLLGSNGDVAVEEGNEFCEARERRPLLLVAEIGGR